jgi:hypothetical protein
MMREWVLELHDGVYCEKIQREHKGSMVDYYRKTLCADFVKLLVSGDPERVKVVLSDKGSTGWTPVKVTRVGHYRWWWEFPGKEWALNSTFGLYRAAEAILMSIFPLDFEEKDDDGKWKPVIFLSGVSMGNEEHILWIRITSYEEVRD